jgi:sarcosine oxidase subunit gamma
MRRTNVSASDPLAPGRFGAVGPEPVRIALLDRGVIQLAARRGRAADLTAGIQAGLGLALPGPGKAANGGEVTALWIEPETWYLVGPRGVEGAFGRRVKEAAGTAGSVVHQSHGRSVIALSGSRARWVLQKLCRIDLHPAAFAAGSVASTPVAGLPCVLHQRDDAPSYELVVFTTFLRSFAAYLTHAADETGYVIA